MALSSFLNVNGYDFPCPRVGFSYTITTTVNAGRNANNAVIGQRIGRDLIKLDNLEWACLEPEVWQMMLKAVEPFYVPVTFEEAQQQYEEIQAKSAEEQKTEETEESDKPAEEKPENETTEGRE